VRVPEGETEKARPEQGLAEGFVFYCTVSVNGIA
jgi:hypothetical protein